MVRLSFNISSKIRPLFPALLPFLVAGALAALCRFGWVVTQPPWPLLWDAKGYHETALRLVEWHTLAYGLQPGPAPPNAFVMPGYPLLVAAVYATGHAQFTVYLLQAFLATATVLTVVLVAHRTGGTRAAWLAGILLALYPPAWLASNSLLTETVYTFGATCMAAGLLLWKTGAARAHRLLWCLGAGAGGGLFALVRPQGILLAGLFLVVVLVDRTIAWRRRLRLAAVIFLAASVVLAPWWIRNAVVLDRVILSCLGGANPFFAGVFPSQEAYNAWVRERWTPAPDPFALQRQQVEHAFRAIRTYYEKDPAGYAQYWLVLKPARLLLSPWLPVSGQAPGIVRTVARIMHALALLGLVVVAVLATGPRTLRRHKDLVWLARVLAALLAVHIVPYWITLPLPRYFFPAMPLLFLGISCLWPAMALLKASRAGTTCHGTGPADDPGSRNMERKETAPPGEKTSRGVSV